MTEAEQVELLSLGLLVLGLALVVYVVKAGADKTTPFPDPCDRCGGRRGDAECLCGLDPTEPEDP